MNKAEENTVRRASRLRARPGKMRRLFAAVLCTAAILFINTFSLFPGVGVEAVDDSTIKYGEITLYHWYFVGDETLVRPLYLLPYTNYDEYPVLIMWASGGNDNPMTGVGTYYYLDCHDFSGHHAYGTRLIGSPLEQYHPLSFAGGGCSFYTSQTFNTPTIQYVCRDDDNHYDAYYIRMSNGQYMNGFDGKKDVDSMRFESTGTAWTAIYGYDRYKDYKGSYTSSAKYNGCTTFVTNIKGVRDAGLQWSSSGYLYAEQDKDYDDFDRFLVWYAVPERFTALTTDYTVESGKVMNIDSSVYIPAGVTLTVEAGGVLSIEGQVFNNGTIVNKGNVILQKNASLSPFEDHRGSVLNDGGNLIIMENARLGIGTDGCLTLSSNSTLVNRGLMMIESYIEMVDSTFENYGFVIGGMTVTNFQNITGASWSVNKFLGFEFPSISGMSYVETKTWRATQHSVYIFKNSYLLDRGNMFESAATNKLSTDGNWKKYN